MRLLIMGPPGAGKGTQAKVIAARLGVPAISTGDIFRANIAEETPLGLKVREILSTGALVPDAITNEMVQDRLGEPDAVKGFLLDGYPRTLAQVDFLDGVLADRALDCVIELSVDGEEVVARLLKRAEIEGRDDDTEDVIRHRQAVYQQETAPLLEVFGARGILHQVDGSGPVDEVTERAVAAVAAAGL